MNAELEEKEKEMYKQVKNMDIKASTKEGIELMRKMMNDMTSPIPGFMMSLPGYEKVILREFNFNAKLIDSNLDDIDIKIIECKTILNSDKIKPAVIYFHGGGAVSGNAENFSLIHM